MKLGPGVRIDRAKLVAAMEAKRMNDGLSLLDATLQCGMSSPTAWKDMRHGAGCHADTFVRVLSWLGTTDVQPFLMETEGDEGW